jgi:hypothetical protein
VEVPSAPPPSFKASLVPWVAPTVALFAIYAVHRLTQLRDSDKSVFDLHKAVAEFAANTRPTILTGWDEEIEGKRLAAIEQTKWRLQQLGGLAERLRRISMRRRWGWTMPPLQQVSISLTAEMGQLRDRVTSDPFDDPTRSAIVGKSEEVEQSIGAFLQALDEALLSWMG